MDQVTFYQALDSACQRELQSMEFYGAMAKKAGDSLIRRVFSDIAQEEEKHFEDLRKFCRLGPNAMKFPQIEDLEISAMLSKPAIDEKSEIKEIIVYAIKCEEEAIALYESLAAACSDDAGRNLYRKIASMERVHKYRFEKILLNIPNWAT